MKRLVLGLLAVAALALTACTGSNAVDQNQTGQFQYTSATPLGTVYPQAERKKAENFTAPLMNGGTLTLSSTLGKVVMLNYWASWCEPCKTETPQFTALYDKIKTEPVAFYGINTKDDESSARSFAKAYGISYPIVFDENGKTALRLGNLPAIGLPFTVLIDKHGRVAAVYTVRMTGVDLSRAIDKLLAES